jgi:hypothetical protein
LGLFLLRKNRRSATMLYFFYKKSNKSYKQRGAALQEDDKNLTKTKKIFLFLSDFCQKVFRVEQRFFVSSFY